MTNSPRRIDGTFFGLEFSIADSAGISFVAICGIASLWISYRALKTGVHNFRHRTVRSEEPRMFAFQVITTILLGLIAIAGAIVWAFGLGIEP